MVNQAVYHGVDQRNEPYTMTANTAQQASPSRVDPEQPKADLTRQDGEWLMLRSDRGVYDPQSRVLDLFDNVVLYRDDGMTLRTAAATVHIPSGSVASDATVHVEGPLGVLDAQGFTATDNGALIHFQGPVKVVMQPATPSNRRYSKAPGQLRSSLAK